ncbi:hypothetical protein [uncultured Clostridium sp.]|uniref:hypothetical protein n=1 Tax=uncultured Clostridium sp. TaxID=59620 RepID=UPI0028E5BA46|nr:hypothetical protein [uncultured Clostridium sp.]
MKVDNNFDWTDYKVVGGIDENSFYECNMCGRNILHVYVVENSLGDIKHLGCECIKKRFKKVTTNNKTFSNKSIARLRKAGVEIDEDFPF